MKILDFFQGLFNFPIDGNMVKSVCWRRHIDAQEGINLLDDTLIDLVIADILVMLSRTSQTYSNRTGSDVFTMSVRGEYIPLADRQAMRNEANRLYKENGEPYRIRYNSEINI